MASTDARPVPIKNTAFRVTFPALDADGDLVTGLSSPDSEVSKDAGTFADATNEATEIATASGMYYLELTSTEMNADTVAVIVKSGTAGYKTTPIVMYPNETGDIDVDATAWNGTAVATPDTAGYPKVTIKDGTGTGEIDTTSGGVLVAAIAANAITATSINADALTAAKFASDVATEIAAPVLAVLGALADAAADGDPTSGDTAMAYIKQLINILIGSAGIVAFPAEAAPANAVSLAEVIRAIHADVTGLNGSAMLTAAAVNAEVVDALNVDTYAEPGQAAPAATASLQAKISYLFKAWRNKSTTDSTTYKLYNDDAATVDQKAALSDDGTTFTSGEKAAGP